MAWLSITAKAAGDKEKFFRGYEREIILFEAAARVLKEFGVDKLPSNDRLQSETKELTTRKAVLQAELRKAQAEEKQYGTLRQNVDALLSQTKEQERNRNYELE